MSELKSIKSSNDLTRNAYEIEVIGYDLVNARTSVQVAFERCNYLTKKLCSLRLELFKALNEEGVSILSKTISREIMECKADLDRTFTSFLKLANI